MSGGLGAFWRTRATEIVKRNNSPGLLWKRIKLTTTRKADAKKRLRRVWKMSSRKSKKGIFSSFFRRGSSRAVESASSSIDPEQYVEEGTARAMEYASAPATFRPPLTDIELEEIRLPAELVAESYARNRDHESASEKLNAMMPQIQALLEESRARIAEAEAQGVDLSIYRKRKGGRGEAIFFTKVEKDRRVALEWNSAGQPIGPGPWGIRFNETIGCLVRRSDLWEVAFTFTSNEYSAFKNTWLLLLRYFVLEDDIDRHWTYVRNEMHNKFKKNRGALKKKFIKGDKYEEDWQRICGMPSTIREESFAYLLLHWGTKYAQDESTRASTNRMKGDDLYFGGSVKGGQYRSYIDVARGDASLSTSWQVLHTKPDMPEEQLGTQRQHWENIAESERLYRESNPEYPTTQSILPIDVESNIMQHEFPHSAGKGYFPILGQTPSSRSRTSTSTSRTNFEYSQTARQIQELQEQVQRQEEELTRARERDQLERSRMQEQIDYLMQRQSQPSYDPQYEAFLAWQRAQGEGGAGGSGFT